MGGVVGLVIGLSKGRSSASWRWGIIGAVLGGIAGVVLRRLVRGGSGWIFHVFPGGVLFAGSMRRDRPRRSTWIVWRRCAGTWYGTLIGLGCGLLFCLVALPLGIYLRSGERSE